MDYAGILSFCSHYCMKFHPDVIKYWVSGNLKKHPMTFKRILFLTTFLLFQFFMFGQKKINPNRKNYFGFAVGLGVGKLKVQNSNWQQGAINYSDSLNSIKADNNIELSPILFYQHFFNRTISIRPSFGLTITNAGKLTYNRKQSADIIKYKAAPIIFSIPVLIKVPSKSISPYFLAGTTFLFRGSPDDEAKKKLPFKGSDILVDIGIGADITTNHFVMSPELKFSSGLLNAKPSIDNFYSNTINKLNRQSITFSVYFRDWFQTAANSVSYKIAAGG